MKTKKLKFPRYNRSQNAACKLSNKDILKIRIMKKRGLIDEDIASVFKVSQTLIRYWTMSDKQRKARNKKQYILYEKNKVIKNKAEVDSKYYKRKIKMMPEFRKYELRKRKTRYEQKTKR